MTSVHPLTSALLCISHGGHLARFFAHHLAVRILGAVTLRTTHPGQAESMSDVYGDVNTLFSKN